MLTPMFSLAQYVEVCPPLHLHAARRRQSLCVCEPCRRAVDYGVTQTHSPLLCCADSKMFNLSDALGRPLFSNIQVCVIFTRAPLACLSDTPYFTPKDQFSLRCMPEDRRARKVRWQTCARMGPLSPHPPCPSVRAGARTSWRRCRVGCRPTRWCAPIVTS